MSTFDVEERSRHDGSMFLNITAMKDCIDYGFLCSSKHISLTQLVIRAQCPYICQKMYTLFLYILLPQYYSMLYCEKSVMSSKHKRVVLNVANKLKILELLEKGC